MRALFFLMEENKTEEKPRKRSDDEHSNTSLTLSLGFNFTDLSRFRFQIQNICMFDLILFVCLHRFRQWNIALYKNKWFDRVILFFILLNCVVMALEKPSLKSDDKVSYWFFENFYTYNNNPFLRVW